MTNGTTHRYTMPITRTTVDKLGVKLYDRVSAVLAELIANAYDSDAEIVTVEAPLGEYLATRAGADKGFTITVTDDGHGMTPDEVNKHYLPVGKDRRVDKSRGTASRNKSRPVMGRKGIGKLAPFGICTSLEVLTAGGELVPGKGYAVAHLHLDYDRILEDTSEPYHPPPGDQDGTYRDTQGTTITLRNFVYRRVPVAETLNRQLAARFGLSRTDWKVCVKDTETESVTEIGELRLDYLSETRIDVDERPVVLEDGTELPVAGWVAISRESYRDEVMAGVRVYARGKIVAQSRDFDIPSGFHGEHTIRSYLIGQITADWLDDDDGDDLVRSDRQDILWNSDRGEALRDWGRKLVRELANKAARPQRDQKWEIFRRSTNFDAKIAEAYDDKELISTATDLAKIVASHSDRGELEDVDFIEQILDLVLAFTPHRVLISKLAEAAAKGQSQMSVIADILKTAHIAELLAAGQVVTERLKIIDHLSDVMADVTDESVFQQLLEEAPWLINPNWTPLTSNQSLNTFRTSFVKWYESKYKEEVVTSAILHQNKRPDFVLLDHERAIQIVEIKPPKHTFNDADFERLHRYHIAMRDFLSENPEFVDDFPNGHKITLVCDSISLSEINESAFVLLESDVMQRITWSEFLRRTENFHRAFNPSVDTPSARSVED